MQEKERKLLQTSENNLLTVVKALLKERKKTLIELSNYIGVTRQGLSVSLANGSIGLNKAILIAEFIEVPINYLISDYKKGELSKYRISDAYNFEIKRHELNENRLKDEISLLNEEIKFGDKMFRELENILISYFPFVDYIINNYPNDTEVINFTEKHNSTKKMMNFD